MDEWSLEGVSQLAHAVILQVIEDMDATERDAREITSGAQKDRVKKLQIRKRLCRRWLRLPNLEHSVWIKLTCPEQMTAQEWVEVIRERAWRHDRGRERADATRTATILDDAHNLAILDFSRAKGKDVAPDPDGCGRRDFRLVAGEVAGRELPPQKEVG